MSAKIRKVSIPLAIIILLLHAIRALDGALEDEDRWVSLHCVFMMAASISHNTNLLARCMLYSGHIAATIFVLVLPVNGALGTALWMFLFHTFMALGILGDEYRRKRG